MSVKFFSWSRSNPMCSWGGSTNRPWGVLEPPGARASRSLRINGSVKISSVSSSYTCRRCPLCCASRLRARQNRARFRLA